ncbi:MAG: glycosyltransferase family 39 protein [Clostridiales bacterium]|jgi:hypothetical protein|nr:glycosyltransferase family 39 protein [Clostridiales bacterium]
MSLPSRIKKTDAPYIACIAAIILAGILFRILFVINVPTEQLYDFAAYKEIAVNIKNGLGHSLGGVPVAWQGPLYPYALGAFYRLFGTESDLAGKILNIILSSLTLILSVPVYGRLIKSRGRTIAAVALTAFLPANIAYVNVLGTEVIFAFILFVIIFLQLFYSDRYLSYPVIGAMTGLAALTKPFMLAFPAVLILLYWLKYKKARATLIFAGVIISCACAVIAPWVFRNYRLFGRFIPVSYNGGYVQFINNNDKNHNGLWMDHLEPGTLNLEPGINVKTSPELEPLFAEEAGRWITSNLGEFLKLGFLRVNETFFDNAYDIPQWAMNRAELGAERNANAISAALALVNKLLAAAGLVFVISRFPAFFKGLRPGNAVSEGDMTAFLTILFFAAVIFVSEGQARYAFPVFPFFVYAIMRIKVPVS